MPQNISPTKTTLQKMFGDSDTTPDIQQGIAIAQKENPNLAPIQMYGPISRTLMSGAQGYTSPAGTIYLNPDQLQGFSPQDIADTIIHENTHATQMQNRGGNPLMEFFREMRGASEPYGQRPDEMEAFQAEKDRRAKMGRMQTAVPSFENPGTFYVPMDTNLPVVKRNQ